MKYFSGNLISAKLITYNRAEKLRLTLKAWNNSKLREIPLEILDNASDDGTPEVIAAAMVENDNIVLYRHNQNIGAICNVLRAYERFETTYCWLLCDDVVLNQAAFDNFHFALNSGPDLLLVSEFAIKQNDIGFEGGIGEYIARGGNFFLQSGFLPALIFKRSFLSDGVLFRCCKAAGCLYPHVALLGQLAMCANRMIVLKNPLIISQPNDDTRNCGVHWLYEGILPSKYLDVSIRPFWIAQYLECRGDHKLMGILKSQLTHRASGTLNFSRSVVINNLIARPRLGLPLIILALVPGIIIKWILILTGREIPEVEKTLVSKRF